MKKTYIIEGEQIEIVDRRQLSVGPIVPNFIWDIYGPIFEYEGLGLIGMLYRLGGQNGQSFNGLHDLMEYGSIGWAKLNKLLNLFVELGFIEVKRPEGKEKVKHFKTTFILLDPPLRVPSQYTELIKKKTIIKAIFELKPEEALFIEQRVFDVEEVKEVKPETPASLAYLIKQEYWNRLSPARRAAMNHPKETGLAKQLVKYGKDLGWDDDKTFEMVFGCYDWLMNDSYWGKKPITLYLIHSKIGEYIDGLADEEDEEEIVVAVGVNPDGVVKATEYVPGANPLKL